MDQDTINRYQPGGDIYVEVAGQYGDAAANSLAAAAQTGDNGTVLYTLSNIRRGNPTVGSANGGTSTLGNFFGQLYNDPLAAPLEQGSTVFSNTASAVNTAAKKALGSLVQNPLTLLITVAVVALVGWVAWKELSRKFA